MYPSLPAAAIMSTKNYYEILRTTPKASFKELRRNYKQLILQCHPDKLQHEINKAEDPNTNFVSAINVTNNAASTRADPNAGIVTSSDELNEEFVAINEAWNTLKDPTRRKLYDAELLLIKFQTHSNIFACVKLTDMKRCTGTTTTNNGSDSGSDNNSGDESRVKSVAEGDIYCYYTYDCRCGGQYIVDESLDSEILNRNHKHVANIHSDKPSSEGQEISQQKQINCDKNPDKNSQAAADSKNSTENAFAPFSGNDDRAGGVSEDSQGTGTATTNGDGDHDDESEVLVECSECSLVIVLT